MAAQAFLYNAAKRDVGLKRHNFETDTFNVTLHSSAYTPDVASDEVFADTAGENATADGYTAGGQALANQSWTQDGAVSNLDANDTEWTSAGSGLTARYAVVRNVTEGNRLLMYILLDDTGGGQDVTAPAGEPFRLQWGANILNAS